MGEEEKKKTQRVHSSVPSIDRNSSCLTKHFYNFLKTKMTAVTATRIKSGNARAVKALLWVPVLMVPLQ
jgi:hypothetical protein